MRFKTIICPTDFSEPADEALRVASDLAYGTDSEIVVVHVLAPVTVPVEMVVVEVPDSLAGQQERQHIAQQRLADRVDSLLELGLHARGVLESGDPAHAIASVAAREQADLVVIATAGRRGWRRLVFGSVAEAVVRSVECPVLTIHEPHVAA